MAKYKFYAIVGDNGYGLTNNWNDIVSVTDYLIGSWPKGFNTEEEAYDWINRNCKLKWAFRNGICSLDTLRDKKFVILDEPGMDSGSNSVKPMVVSSAKKTLKDLLDEDDNDDVPIIPMNCGRKRNYKQELVKAFDAWLTDCMSKLDGK